MMGDGDNVQWLLGNFCSSEHYWASPDHGAYPIGWGLPYACLDQVSPDALLFLQQTQPQGSTGHLHAGGYYYPDMLGLELAPTERRQLLVRHARRISHYMQRAGRSTLLFLCMDIDSAAAMEAYETFAQEIEGLDGMFVQQYYPYTAGEGRVIWVKNRQGVDIPVIPSRYGIWANTTMLRSGTPAKVARLINADAEEAEQQGDRLNAWTIVHTWSGFRKIDGNDEDAENSEFNAPEAKSAVTPALWCVERLKQNVKVVTPDELVWRIRRRHDLDQTRR